MGKLNLQLSDRVIFPIINITSNIKDSISIVKPETVLKWQRNLIKKSWTFNIKTKKTGRPQVNQEIKNLILQIIIITLGKNDNIYWGVRRIVGTNICETTFFHCIFNEKSSFF